MKLDAFEQYIHDQYQGYEVAAPPAMEAVVMGRLWRMKWTRRVSGAVLTLAIGAGAIWGWSERSVPSDYAPIAGVQELPAIEVAEAMEEEVVTASADAPVEVPAPLNVRDEESRVWPRPDRVDPLPHLTALLPVESAWPEGHTLQSTESTDQLWVISAEVEVEH